MVWCPRGRSWGSDPPRFGHTPAHVPAGQNALWQRAERDRRPFQVRDPSIRASSASEILKRRIGLAGYRGGGHKMISTPWNMNEYHILSCEKIYKGWPSPPCPHSQALSVGTAQQKGQKYQSTNRLLIAIIKILVYDLEYTVYQWNAHKPSSKWSMT